MFQVFYLAKQTCPASRFSVDQARPVFALLQIRRLYVQQVKLVPLGPVDIVNWKITQPVGHSKQS